MNADQVRALAAEYKDVGKELSAVTQAQAAYNANVAKFGQDSDKAVAWAKKLATAEGNLAAAVKKRQDRQAGQQGLNDGVRIIRAETDALKEQSRLRGMGAEAVERLRIEKQRSAYEASLFSDLEKSQRHFRRPTLLTSNAIRSLHSATLTRKRLCQPALF